jgi:class 3 adenylate cyclase
MGYVEEQERGHLHAAADAGLLMRQHELMRLGSEIHPETGYATLGEERIAYQVIGDGPSDLVLSWGSFSNADVDWDEPGAARFYRSLASFCRLIRYSRRGTAGSDRLALDDMPPWESYAEELVAVMDAVGSKQAAVMGVFDGGPMAALFAAVKPERTTALILANTSARFVAADDYPIGVPADLLDQIVEMMEQTWGTEAQAQLQVPSQADNADFRRWYARYLRTIATPRAVSVFFRALATQDARSILPSIQVPTLVMHREDYALLPIDHGRYLADHIAGAEFIALPGADAPLIWEQPDLVTDAIRRFLTGSHHSPDTDRVLATVLFTDIVGSTKLATELGDRRWRELLDRHQQITQLRLSNGRLVKSIGDGILATFDGPGRAIRCARQVRDALDALGLPIRAGIHTGEIETQGADVAGITVHIASRVMDSAAPNQILVSRTVRDLVAGSDIPLADEGTHRLKGIDEPWQLFSLAEA